jgi:hypothetical protein
MKNTFFLAVILLCSCTTLPPEPDCDLTHYSYNPSSGVCENCLGRKGYNIVNLEQIRKTKEAECLKLSKMELLLLLGDSVEIPNRWGGSVLLNYNFRGSKLDSCSLILNDIRGADLQGTDLSTLQYGYATVQGRKDGFTKLPSSGLFTFNGDSVKCEQ